MTEPDAGSAITDLTTTRDARRQRLPHQRHQDLHHAIRTRTIYPRLRALRAGRRRHRLGDDRGAAPRASRSASRRNSCRANEWAPLYLRQRATCRPKTCCCRRAASRSRSPASTPSASATRRARSRYGRYCLRRSRASYAMTRKQFGRPLCEFQGLQWKFADMKIKLDAAQLLLYRAATNADRGLPSRGRDRRSRSSCCNQAGFDVGERSDAGDGRPRLQRRRRSSSTACAARAAG